MNLRDQRESAIFYDARYTGGYMDDWPRETKRRIAEIVKELPLPKTGHALDYGCGNGVLTEVLREALPGWNISGTDISPAAVRNARIRYPECNFFEPVTGEVYNRKFDFVFTHHVLEHVYDLETVIGEIDFYLKRNSSVLHILPCGNAGSYEYNLCMLRKDGIDRDSGRFFFEEEGHLRRLKSEELAVRYIAQGFVLEKQYFSNQFYGAVDWITAKHPRFIIKVTEPEQAVSEKARGKLIKERMRLLIINMLKLPAVIFSMLMRERKKHSGHVVLMVILVPFLVSSYPLDFYVKMKARREWEASRRNAAGSEMFLFFRREG